MSLQLYMDVHVPGPITRGLRSRGIDVLTAQDDATEEWDDPDLLLRATELNRVLVTFDDDFFRIIEQFEATGRGFTGCIYIAHGTHTHGQCIREILAIANRGS